MSTFKEKERLKEQQEQFQAVLSALLKDEDNKYCVDCDAKGPRWASWNIGIFLCIRCAGIHRNLGVHISKVKSVNLDTWTPEQVAMMQEMGNSRGRAVYEANIPDGFRRPQTDSSLEAFIRSKYEQKKYIAREWVPPQPKVPKEWLDDPRGERKKAKAKPATSSVQLTNVPKLVSKPGETTPPGDFPKASQGPKAEVKVAAKTETVSNSASNDLLGLDLGTAHTNAQQAAAPPPSYGNNELLDLFGGPQVSQNLGDTVPVQSNGSDLMNGATEESLFGEDKGTGGGANVKTSAKDSIMALYGGGGGGGGGTPQPQMYGVPAAHSELTITNSPAHVAGSHNLTKTHNSLISSQAFDQRPVMFGQTFSQSQTMMQPMLNQSGTTFSSPVTHQSPFNQSATALASQQPKFSQNASGITSNQTAYNSYVQSGQYQLFNQSSIHGLHQQTALMSNTAQDPTASSPFLSTSKQMPGFTNTTNLVMEPQDFGLAMESSNAWNNYNLAQSTFYGTQGGVYMPQGQQMYPRMVSQQQGMMGMQGLRQQGMMGQPQGMMGQPQGMMGQPQGMGMMGQTHGMMAPPAMNTPQMAMYNSPMMAGNPGMYTPQQMQQLQFHQMQQQMTSLKLSGSQISTVPQQTPGAGGWGNPGQGQTLSTNLWQ